jgi:hypothetical protein
MQGRWLPVAGSLVLLAVGVVAGFLLRGGGGHSGRAALVRVRAAERRLADRLGVERLNERRNGEYAIALEHELLAFAGARSGGSICSSHDFPHIRVAILSPRADARVHSPVIAHLLTTRPLGCYSEYYVTIDGKPFEPAPSTTRNPRVAQPPESPEHPMATRLVPRSQRKPPNAACFGGAYQYLRFGLRPGRHVITIDGGCEMGTEVPQPIPESVAFAVMR